MSHRFGKIGIESEQPGMKMSKEKVALVKDYNQFEHNFVEDQN